MKKNTKGIAIASAHGCSLHGLTARAVRVEVDVRPANWPKLTVSGMFETSEREMKLRVRSALSAAGVSLADRDVRIHVGKGAGAGEVHTDPGLDLPIALAVAAACGALTPQAVEALADPMLITTGELALIGKIHAVRGVAAMLRSSPVDRWIVPHANAIEIPIVDRHPAYQPTEVARTLADVIAALNGGAPLEVVRPGEYKPQITHVGGPDLLDVPSASARRALEIAAAGGHDLLLIGSPGSGKTMLARRLTGILPLPTREEAEEIAAVHGAAGLPNAHGIRPFRWRPGEVSLAHGGVLFLDQVLDFTPAVLRAVRAAYRDGMAGPYPARFALVAGVDPCGCGYDDVDKCTCSPAARTRYKARLTELASTFDLTFRVEGPSLAELIENGKHPREDSAAVRERVTRARAWTMAPPLQARTERVTRTVEATSEPRSGEKRGASPGSHDDAEVP